MSTQETTSDGPLPDSALDGVRGGVYEHHVFLEGCVPPPFSPMAPLRKNLPRLPRRLELERL